MKKTIVRSLFVLVILFNCALVQSMDDHVVYKRADDADHASMLQLISEKAIGDADKLVILPRPFRSGALQSAIDANQLFVANKSGQVVSYKKMFVISDEHERDETLSDELRMIGTTPVVAGTFNQESRFTEADQFNVPADETLFIYNGAEFTHPDHRGQGINRALTAAAVTTLMPEIRAQLTEHTDYKNVAVVYGMVEANAGAVPGDNDDHRTRISLAGLRQVMRELDCNPSSVMHARYRAYKPSFDLEGTECKPLPDEQAVAGYGNIVLAQLSQTAQLQQASGESDE